jgi:tRNA-specific 2-thiouridylase
MFDALTNWLPEKPARIAVAMSGGVDSSVVAHLLAKAGHEIVGLTAWTLNGPGKCCNDALVNAGRVCEELGAPFDTVDLRAEFAHYVLNYYNNTYEAGLTPNPCVECNRHVKWEALVRYARQELGVDYVATGHYVNLDRPLGADGPFRVLRSVDQRKDQTYMLARVLPEDLQYALFPLGLWVKPDVVAYAKEVNIPTAYSKESMDVCFVLDGQANYLRGALGRRPGPIVDIDTGRVLGEHEGYFQHTVGQRKGLGVGAGRPVYVVRTDPQTNIVYVGDAHHLESRTFRVLDVNWLAEPKSFPAEVMVKIRYNTPPQAGIVLPSDSEPGVWEVRLHHPVPAVTSAQIAAFYDPTDTQLLGGGYIEKRLTHAAFDPAEVVLPDLNVSCSL